MKNKLNAIIADDEYIILKGLKNILDWDALQINIVGEARNGEELYNLVTEKKPEIVISDIAMPKMTGLEVLKAIKEKNIDTNFIFISGYQDFEYVREALRLEAGDYLLKPINENALYDIVLKIKNKLLIKKENDNEFGIITDDIKSFAVLVLSIDTNSLNNVFEHLSSLNLDVIKYHDYICKIYTIDNDAAGFAAAVNDAERILSELTERFKIRIDGAIGQAFIGTKKIINSYNDALIALQYSYFFDNNRIYKRKDISLFAQDSKTAIRDLLNNLIENIKELNEQKITEGLSLVSNHIKKDSLGVKDIAVMKLFSAVEYIRHTVNNPILEKMFDEALILKTLKDTEKFSEAAKYVEDMIIQFVRSISSSKKSRNTFEIEKIKEYIEANISENVKLETVAKIAYMNTYYFSVFFKKHTGVNFKDYVMKLKMEKAYSLIQDTDMKIYEVTEAVGFCDQKHFSNVFKKYFGISATDLRKE